MAERRHFFHWALEFPEVMLARGGFDAVIGNPPWNTLSPDIKEFFTTYDPTVFLKGIPKATQTARKEELRDDAEIDRLWREQARFLHELSVYAKPESGRFDWYAPDGQLRKGDANVFRLFVERAYRLLRKGGRLAQVLPDSFYVSSPATGLRQHLLQEGRLERCFVFENRRGIFPIDSRIKVVLMVAERAGGPTDRFRAAFFVGKDPAGRDRAIGLDTMPERLADLDRDAPQLSVEQIRQLAPETWSFPELQTALDAEVAAHCAKAVPPLNLDDRGWNLEYCRELDADTDSWRFHLAADIAKTGATRNGLRWLDVEGADWWPLVEGTLFYHLEFPQEGKEPKYWVRGPDIEQIEARRNPDGSSVTHHYRVAWRDIASTTNERSAIAAVLPPRSVAKGVPARTVWGGSLNTGDVAILAGLISSFVFDYLVRFRGITHLNYTVINSVPAPGRESLQSLIHPVAEAVCSVMPSEFGAYWEALVGKGESAPVLDSWEIGMRRALIDAEVAFAYGLSLAQYAAVLCSFPTIDRVQPMLPGEPKSFVTRDLALLTYCERAGARAPDVAKLMRDVAVDLPDPREEYRLVDARLQAYQALGAVPYRATPKGGKPPTDPALIAEVLDLLSSDALTAEELAEGLEEEQKTIATVLKALVKKGDVFREGKGKKARYYVLEDDEQ